jgi:hypothetical protein
LHLRLLEESLCSGPVIGRKLASSLLDGLRLIEVVAVPEMAVSLLKLLVMGPLTSCPRLLNAFGVPGLPCPPFDEDIQFSLYPLDLLYVQLLPLSFIDCSDVTISSEKLGK